MQGSMLLLTANWLFLTTQKLCAAVSFGSTPCGDPFWTFSIWEQVAESSPFQRVASNPGEPCAKKAKTAFSFGLAAWDLWGAHCFAQNCSMGRGKGNQALQCGVVCKNRFPCAILRLQYPRPSRCRCGTTPAPAQMWILLNIKTCPLRRAAGR